MENFNLEKEAEILRKKGKDARGEILVNLINYIKKKEGDNGYKKIVEKLKELNYEIDLDNIKSNEWYPKRINVLIYLICIEIFNWTEKDIFEIGSTTAKVSGLGKVFIKYFMSLEKMCDNIPQYWSRFLDFGRAEVVTIKKDERYYIGRLIDFDMHPIECEYIKGFLTQITSFVVEGDIKAEETKCLHKGDSCHEFKISW